MTLISKNDADSVKMKQRAKYLDPRSFCPILIGRIHTQTHSRPIARPGSLRWSVGLGFYDSIERATIFPTTAPHLM